MAAASTSARAILALLALLAWFWTALAFAAPDYPASTGRVVDQANVIAAPARASITAKLKALEDKSAIQIAVATVKSLGGRDIESYANGLFRAWKLGEARKNNGVLFLIAPGERKMRIEVGYGLEGTLTDAVSKIIITTAVAPRFKAGDFGGGIERGVDAIVEVLSTDKSEWTERAKKGEDRIEDLLDLVIPFLILALFVYIFLTMANNARGGPPGAYRRRRRDPDGPVVIFAPSDSSRDGGGWDSGGSSWGGGDGFSGGGGSSGGGGASGDW